MSFPLAPPAGMRDLLPPEAASRSALTSRLTERFTSWGYQLVTTPPFEHAEVIERGLDGFDRRDLFRFVEPETGEVALLRPDITPQIARIVATQLAGRPLPYRLCYRGSVVRRRRFRARTQRLMAQVGVEHLGTPGADADVEVMRLAASAVERAGLEDFELVLALVGPARRALLRLSGEPREEAERALSRKDRAGLASVLKGADEETRRTLMGVAGLYGEPEAVLKAARKVLRSDEDKLALRQLRAILRPLDGRRISVDLGEVRGMSYYTGVSFSLLARGPGSPIASGGRYDGLIGRFGDALPATGFALDVGNLERALDEAGVARASSPQARFVVLGKRDERIGVARKLREAGHVAAVQDGGVRAALDYAAAWGYDAVVRCGADVTRVADRATRSARSRDWDSVARWARRGRN